MLSLARARLDPEEAVPTVLEAAANDRVVLELARTRVLAALDGEPGNTRISAALEILDASLVRLELDS
ncbi:MAG: hypothetical protein ACRDY6_16930 [Acidimicrobiia bacterium]